MLGWTFRYFPSGTTAFQSFQAGLGDVIVSGDLPALTYPDSHPGDYRVIAPVERDSTSYIVAAKSSIRSPKDLQGKTIATRVGSTGSYRIDGYFKKYNLDLGTIKIVNLDPGQMISALDRGDVDAFFIWQPFGDRAVQVSGDRVHILADATGIVRGYNIMGARQSTITAQPQTIVAFLRATIRAQEFAVTHRDEQRSLVMAQFHIDQGYIDAETKFAEMLYRFDKTFYDDFSREASWVESAGLIKRKLDFSGWLWTDGLRSVDRARVAER